MNAPKSKLNVKKSRVDYFVKIAFYKKFSFPNFA